MSGRRNETEIAPAKEIHFQALCAPNMLMNVHRVKNQGPIVQMSKVKVNPTQGISPLIHENINYHNQIKVPSFTIYYMPNKKDEGLFLMLGLCHGLVYMYNSDYFRFKNKSPYDSVFGKRVLTYWEIKGK